MRKIYHAVSQILGEILSLQPDEVAPDTTLSSLHYQELAAAAIACEKTFHITMEDEQICGLVAVEDWVEYVRKRIEEENENKLPATEKEREAWYYR